MDYLALSRLTTPQLMIFIGTTLVISVVANLFLFLDTNQVEKELLASQTKIQTLEKELAEQKAFRDSQLSRLNEMGGQQSELGGFIQQLQVELNKLQQEYQQSTAIAKQTKEKLSMAQSEIKKLGQQTRQKDRQLTQLQNELETLKKESQPNQEKLAATLAELDQAKLTIRNQQRALKSNQSTLNQNRFPETAATLSTAFSSIFEDIAVTQTSEGSTVVNIPLEYIFLTGGLTFTADADRILETISEELINLPDADVTVVGHSDARPIVSELSDRYPTNWELSTARASQVVNMLVARGVAENQLTAAGKASNEPVREEYDVESFAINRRIEIQIH